MSVAYAAVSGYGFEMTEELAKSLGMQEDDCIVNWVDENSGTLPVCIYDQAGDSYSGEERVYIRICNTDDKTLDEALFCEIKEAEKIWNAFFEVKGIKCPEFTFYNALWVY